MAISLRINGVLADSASSTISSTIAALPTAGTVGLVARVTDGIRGIWMYTGTQWLSVTGYANVKDFGAIGNGVTNDTAAVQAAVDALPAIGGTVFIPINTVWDYTALTGLTDRSVVFEDWSSPIFPKRWHWRRGHEFQLVGRSLPPEEVNGGPNVALVNSSTGDLPGDPHGPGFVARYGRPTVPGFPDVPYNLWQVQFGNWGNQRLIGSITAGLATLVVTTPSFIAGDVGRSIVVTGAGVASASLVTTIATYIGSTQVTLTTAAGTTQAAASIQFVNADDLQVLAWQPESVYGTVSRVNPTSPGTQVGRLVWGQNGVVIWNPSGNSSTATVDPIAARDGDFYQVFLPGGSTAATVRLLMDTNGADGATGIDFVSNHSATIGKRLELIATTNNLRIRNGAHNATIWELTDTGNATFGVDGATAAYIDIFGDSNSSGVPFRIGRGPFGMFSNTGVGAGALSSITNVSAGGNSAVGYQALGGVTLGVYNTAVGVIAGGSITTGTGLTAIGYNAALSSTGNANTAIGSFSLRDNGAGVSNVAIGASSMVVATNVSRNTAVGEQTLSSLTTGGNNTAIGSTAGYGVTTGQKNVLIGWNAGAAGNLAGGSNNVIIGGNDGSSIAGLSDYMIFATGAGTERMRIDSTGQLALIGKIGTYNNVVTAGQGVPSIYSYGDVAAATNVGTASIATYTVGAADGTFEVGANCLVTTATTHSFSLDVTYTDESNVARTMILPVAALAGSFITGGLITNTTGAGPYEAATMTIRAKAATAITVRTSAGGTFTAVVYNARGTIKQIG